MGCFRIGTPEPAIQKERRNMAVRRSCKEADNEADMLSDMPESLQLRILSCLDVRQAIQTMVLLKSWVSKWTCTPKKADRLSDLPESLQLRILSCLDARHAVQTLALSKSWVSWAYVPVLNFSSNDFCGQTLALSKTWDSWAFDPDNNFNDNDFWNTRDFDKFVFCALSHHQPVKLDRITFKHEGKYRPKSLEKVFDYAFSHGVRELEANVPYIKSWPIGLHTSSDSLTSLKLVSLYFATCLFFKPRSGSFINLTSLHLRRLHITDPDPFSGFPELDKLRLEFCLVRTEGNALNVHAPKLSEFTNLCCDWLVNHCEFMTPKLRYFEWRGANFPPLVTREGGFPILDMVVIDYNGSYEDKQEARVVFDHLLMSFNCLHNARSLKVFLPVVSLLTLFPLNGCSPFRKLKCLKLDLRPFCNQNLLRGPCRSELKLLELVPGLKAYLLPKSHDAKCIVMVMDCLRPQAMAVLDSAFFVN